MVCLFYKETSANSLFNIADYYLLIVGTKIHLLYNNRLNVNTADKRAMYVTLLHIIIIIMYKRAQCQRSRQ